MRRTKNAVCATHDAPLCHVCPIIANEEVEITSEVDILQEKRISFLLTF